MRTGSNNCPIYQAESDDDGRTWSKPHALPFGGVFPDLIEMADGTVHEADVLLYGTGYEASKFLTPMTVKGRDGIDLHEQWQVDARAYLGVSIPGFPNFFCLYGPNTNIVINGSIIYFSECEVRYLTEAVRLLLETGRRSLSVRPDVHDAFGVAVDEANRQMAWGASDVNSWYKNATGRVAQNWPLQKSAPAVRLKPASSIAVSSRMACAGSSTTKPRTSGRRPMPRDWRPMPSATGASSNPMPGCSPASAGRGASRCFMSRMASWRVWNTIHPKTDGSALAASPDADGSGICSAWEE